MSNAARILLANHDQRGLERLSRSLKDGGGAPLDIELWSKGTETVEKVTGDYDAIVCAVENEAQIEVLARLKKGTRRPTVIAIVPPDDAELEARARRAGADGVFQQQSEPETLADLLRAVLEIRLLSVRSSSLAEGNRAQWQELGRRIAVGATTDTSGGPFPVLVVDDDVIVSQFLRRAFERHGFTRLNSVSSLGDAISLMTGEGRFRDRNLFPVPYLVLLDLHLGKESGFDFLRWLRSREEFRQVVVIVNSSSERPEDIRRAADLGANSYVLKPTTPEQFQELAKGVGLFWMRLNMLGRTSPFPP